MHYFELRNIQHMVLYLLPAVLGVLIFAIGLARVHFRSDDDEKRMHEVHTTYVGGIEERNAPFPLVLILIIGGTVIWGFLYIILYGVLGVKL
jgi:RsiW-degrading membrane proteinase PrsW (M82 family)